MTVQEDSEKAMLQKRLEDVARRAERAEHMCERLLEAVIRLVMRSTK